MDLAEMTAAQIRHTGLTAMSPEAFVEDAWKGLVKGEDNIPVGMTRQIYDACRHIPLPFPHLSPEIL